MTFICKKQCILLIISDSFDIFITIPIDNLSDSLWEYSRVMVSKSYLQYECVHIFPYDCILMKLMNFIHNFRVFIQSKNRLTSKVCRIFQFYDQLDCVLMCVLLSSKVMTCGPFLKIKLMWAEWWKLLDVFRTIFVWKSLAIRSN